jgi:predicted LPLAT superfamily acyltransferase
MTLTLSQPDSMPDTGAICLSGHGTTVTAEDLRMQCVAASDLGDGIAIDASDSLSVGQAVLQVLIAARIEATLSVQPHSFLGASAAFADRVTSCQLADAIGLEIGKDVSQ